MGGTPQSESDGANQLGRGKRGFVGNLKDLVGGPWVLKATSDEIGQIADPIRLRRFRTEARGRGNRMSTIRSRLRKLALTPGP